MIMVAAVVVVVIAVMMMMMRMMMMMKMMMRMMRTMMRMMKMKMMIIKMRMKAMKMMVGDDATAKPAHGCRRGERKPKRKETKKKGGKIRFVDWFEVHSYTTMDLPVPPTFRGETTCS